MSITLSIDLNSIYYLPDWVCHPTIIDRPFLFQREGAEQGRGEWGEVQRRHLWVTGVLQQRDRFARSAIEVRCLRCEAPKPYISNNNDNDTNNDLLLNNDGNDNLNDGTEDANHNGRIDGDNGDGINGESETWTETSPNEKDSDGDSFEDKFEKDHQYNPLSRDTDGDGLTDDEEDEDGDGSKDSTETSVIESDTDGDGLSDKMEIDGWTVIIILEATLEIEEERDVYSDPLIPDIDEDGINDCGEFENGTDPNDDDTDNDGFLDKYEIDYDVGSSPTGIDGQPPTITDFDADYELVTETSGPLWNLKIVVEYQVQIEISASDIFGIDWINVHLGGVGDEKIFCGGSTEVSNKEFDFTLDAGQAMRSLFKSFEVNITAEDKNRNIGFNREEVPSIINLQFSNLSGKLNGIIILLDIIIEKLISIIIEKLIEYFKNKIDYLSSFKYNINNYQESINIIEDAFNIFEVINNNKYLLNFIPNEYLPYQKISNIISEYVIFLINIISNSDSINPSEFKDISSLREKGNEIINDKTGIDIEDITLENLERTLSDITDLFNLDSISDEISNVVDGPTEDVEPGQMLTGYGIFLIIIDFIIFIIMSIITILVALGVVIPDGFEWAEIPVFVIILAIWLMSLLAVHMDVMSYHYTSPNIEMEGYIEFMGSKVETRDEDQSSLNDVKYLLIFPIVCLSFGSIVMLLIGLLFAAIQPIVAILSVMSSLIIDVIYIISSIAYYIEVSS